MKHKFAPIPELQTWASVRGNGLLLANGLGVKPPTVSDWVTGKKSIPMDKVMPIETFTKGAVTRRNMRPHDYLIHWPELAQAHTQPAPPAIKTEVKDVDPPVKLPPLATTEDADKLVLQERRIGQPTRRLRQQPFTGPEKRVCPPDRRGFKLPEVAAVLPEGL